MSSYDEIKKLITAKGIKDTLDKNEKLRISNNAHAELPIALDIMACYDDNLPAIDIDRWNASKDSIHSLMIASLPDIKYYLFIKSYPKNFLLLLSKCQLVDIVLTDEFYYPFVALSPDLKSFLMEDDSGSVIGCGIFLKVVSNGL